MKKAAIGIITVVIIGLVAWYYYHSVRTGPFLPGRCNGQACTLPQSRETE